MAITIAPMTSTYHATTILSVRRDSKVAIGGDGQVTLDTVIAKADAVKVRKLDDVGAQGAGVLVGFAGSAADAFALLDRFEDKLKNSPANIKKAAIELAKLWRTDRALRQLQSLLAVADRECSLLVSGSGDVIEPADGIASGDTCNRCHVDIRFHGGLRRGYDTCVLCHMAGSEDRPPYVAGGAPPTTGATVDFRTMIHKIHHGSSLAAGEDYVLVGFGFRPFPNNFTPHTYDDVVFPVWPGGTAECRVCHGDENESWVSPEGRTHPMGQEIETRSWRAACGSCHDSGAARAHIEVNTTSDGSESCALCHGEGEDEAVRDVHRKQ